MRVRETGALASRLGVSGSPKEVAAALIAAAPIDLAEVWDTLPGLHFLAERITCAPLSWRDGYEAGRAA